MENNELKREVKKLSNKLERCYNSKATFEHMLKTQRNYGDKCGLGFNKSMTKRREKNRKEDEEARKREAISFHVLQMPWGGTSC
jgi:hypothetical protein